MQCLGILVMLWDLSLAFTAPVDTMIVQVQQWGVVGAQRVMDQVLLNGVPLTDASQEVDNIVQAISADALLPTLVSVDQSLLPKNHTVLHSRECILEGSQLHWNDRVFCDGEVYLTLEHNDMWTAHVPKALAIKALWDQEVERTKTERIRLEEGCVKLMRELRLSEGQSAQGIPLPQFLIPAMALVAFIGLVLISLVLSKAYGLRHPGGVIGSIIHYPKDMTDMSQELKGNGYRTL